MGIGRKMRFIMIAMLFMPFLVPEFLLENTGIKTVVLAFRIIVLMDLIIKIILSRFKVSSDIIMLIGIYVILAFSTLFNSNGSVYVLIHHFVTFFAPAMLLYYYLDSDYVLTIKEIFYILSIEIILNTASQFIYPNGLYLRWDIRKSFLLGIENRFVFTYIAFLAFGCAMISINKKYRRFFHFILLLINISLIYAWSVGAMLGIICFDVIYVLSLFKVHFITFKSSTVLWIASFFLIVVVRVQNAFSVLLKAVFNKNASLSGRTELWDSAFSHISKAPFLGYGATDDKYLLLDFLGFSHPHNQVLYTIYIYGIIGLVAFGVFGFLCIKNVASIKGKNEIYYYYVAVYFSMMVILLVDSWTSTSYFFMIFILFSKTKKTKKTLRFSF